MSSSLLCVCVPHGISISTFYSGLKEHKNFSGIENLILLSVELIDKNLFVIIL